MTPLSFLKKTRLNDLLLPFQGIVLKSVIFFPQDLC